MSTNWIKYGLLFCTAWSLSTAFAEPGKFYRYTDKDGTVVISNTLPSDTADRGYEIIDDEGDVVESIAPRATREQIKQEEKKQLEIEAAKQRAQKFKEDAAMQKKEDNILLKSFSKTADLERTRDDKIASIEVVEHIAQKNLTQLELKLKELQDTQKDFETIKEDFPEELKESLKETLEQIKSNKAFIARKQAEKQRTFAKFERLIKRFKELQPEPASIPKHNNESAQKEPLSTNKEIQRFTQS